MLGIRRAGAVPPFPEHQSVGTKNVIETVPAYYELLLEILSAQFVQLSATGFRQVVVFAEVLAVEDYAAAQNVHFIQSIPMLITPLS